MTRFVLPLEVKCFIYDRSKDWKWFDTLTKRNEPVLCLILNLLGNSLIYSLHHSRALSLMLDRFQTNNTLSGSQGVLYNFSLTHLRVMLSYMYSYLTLLMANIKNRKKLPLIQTIWNVMLYLQQLTFHWNILVLVNNFVREWLAWTQVATWASMV